MALAPAGLMLSNGPGDPVDVPGTVETVRALLGRLPIFGICLGHQVLGLAVGGKTYKLKFGHRGANHPVKDLRSGTGLYHLPEPRLCRGRRQSLPPEVEVSHVNVNDGTVEGLRHLQLPAWSVQYHPEAAPGPADSAYLFAELAEALQRRGVMISHEC